MSLKVDINPDVKSEIWVLEPQKTFVGYYEKYGDELAERYERGALIVVPLVPLKCDLAFLQGVTFPLEWKKIGTVEGLDRDIVVRDQSGVKWNPKHPFASSDQKVNVSHLYLYEQIKQVNQQIRIGLRQMFPRYYALEEFNITWRFTQSENEAMHYDGYPAFKDAVRDMRLKFFINMDSMPRIWQVSHHLSHFLETSFDPRLEDLPQTINGITARIGATDVLAKEPVSRIEWPALAAVFGNGDVVAHELKFGRRVIGGDFSLDPRYMLHPELQAEKLLPSWLEKRAQARMRMASPR